MKELLDTDRVNFLVWRFVIFAVLPSETFGLVACGCAVSEMANADGFTSNADIFSNQVGRFEFVCVFWPAV